LLNNKHNIKSSKLAKYLQKPNKILTFELQKLPLSGADILNATNYLN
jgi:hypothetical protein